jgi:putative transposase
MYSIPVSDPRISELIAWYLKTLQRAVDEIWGNIAWKYMFPRRMENKESLFQTSSKSELPKSKSFKKKLRDEFLLDCHMLSTG